MTIIKDYIKNNASNSDKYGYIDFRVADKIRISKHSHGVLCNCVKNAKINSSILYDCSLESVLRAVVYLLAEDRRVCDASEEEIMLLSKKKRRYELGNQRYELGGKKDYLYQLKINLDLFKIAEEKSLDIYNVKITDLLRYIINCLAQKKKSVLDKQLIYKLSNTYDDIIVWRRTTTTYLR
jgi:hypothetical protein